MKKIWGERERKYNNFGQEWEVSKAKKKRLDIGYLNIMEEF